jgi:hypothetical protein
VKAAILASCDTSTLPNIPQATDTGSPNLFTSFENTFGSGFLRVDWLGDLCQRLPASQCLVTEVPFSGNTHTVTYTPAGAAAGTFFTAVAVWNRIDGDHTDLDLTVDCLNGTSTLKSFTTDRRSGIYEKLTFPLPTGTTQIRVHLVRHSGLSSLPVQLVVRPPSDPNDGATAAARSGQRELPAASVLRDAAPRSARSANAARMAGNSNPIAHQLCGSVRQRRLATQLQLNHTRSNLHRTTA